MSNSPQRAQECLAAMEGIESPVEFMEKVKEAMMWLGYSRNKDDTWKCTAAEVLAEARDMTPFQEEYT